LPAYNFWHSFTTPIQLSSLSEINHEAVFQLASAGLVRPVDREVNVSCSPQVDTLSAWLHVTNACPLDCVYCYVQKSAQSMSLETGLAAIDTIFRSAQSYGYRRVSLKYSGGEPALQLERVLKMHGYAVEKAARLGLELDAVFLSNGILLDKQAIAALKRIGLRLMLSIDGMGKWHNAQRLARDGSNSFDQTWQALELAIDGGLSPFISITVTETSAEGLGELISNILPLDLPFNLNLARPTTSNRVTHIKALSVGLREAFHQIEVSPPTFSLLGSILDRAFFAYPHDKPCGAGDSYMVIDHAGQIARCQMTLSEKVTHIGADDPLGDIRRTEGGKNPGVDQKEGCRECQWRYICAGGCPLSTFYAVGNNLTRSPFCGLYQDLFPEILRLEAIRLLKYGYKEKTQ
jgi:uncharacterized protein